MPKLRLNGSSSENASEKKARLRRERVVYKGRLATLGADAIVSLAKRLRATSYTLKRQGESYSGGHRE